MQNPLFMPFYISAGIAAPIVQSITREVTQQVTQQVTREVTQQLLLAQIDARFGKIPDDFREKIRKIERAEELKKIATELMMVQTIDELKSLVH